MQDIELYADALEADLNKLTPFEVELPEDYTNYLVTNALVMAKVNGRPIKVEISGIKNNRRPS